MASGQDLVDLASRHIAEKYANVLVPKSNPRWTGPWDCAEFASWCVFQVAGVLYGCIDDHADPAIADAYTGAWERDGKDQGEMIAVDRAATIAGAVVLRYPPMPGAMGHIAFCDGRGGTVEAHSTARGVISDTVAGRRWDTGILVPGLLYDACVPQGPVAPPRTAVYRLVSPPMAGPEVRKIQERLQALGIDPGPIDGEFGPLTHAAVVAFQQLRGLVPGGEVGPHTAAALGITLRPAR
jgi:N-acetylmuramoyl-L-alanine amidase